MLHKKTIFLATFTICASQYAIASFILDTTPYQKAAKKWIKSLYNTQNDLLVTTEDFQHIANLCYFSFMRSYYTLKAQSVAMKTITVVWNGWQNIASKRLDPSNEISYHITDEQKEIMSLFWHMHDEHHRIGTTYANAVNAVVHGDALTTVKALSSVNTMRSRARSVVAQALLDLHSLLENLFQQKKSLGTFWKGWSLIKHLSNYIPQLALSSLVEADNLNTTISAQAWKTIETIQNLGIQTWEKIEETRASFYLAYYEMVCTTAKKLQIKLPCIFDCNGYIPPADRTEYLSMEKDFWALYNISF